MIEEDRPPVNPDYAQGELVVVSSAINQVDAELIQGMLLNEGIPSVVKRSPGVDVPDMLVAGRRQVWVPQSGLAAAQEALGNVDRGAVGAGQDSPRKILAGLLIAIVIVAVIVVIGVALR